MCVPGFQWHKIERIDRLVECQDFLVRIGKTWRVMLSRDPETDFPVWKAKTWKDNS